MNLNPIAAIIKAMTKPYRDVGDGIYTSDNLKLGILFNILNGVKRDDSYVVEMRDGNIFYFTKSSNHSAERLYEEYTDHPRP